MLRPHYALPQPAARFQGCTALHPEDCDSPLLHNCGQAVHQGLLCRPVCSVTESFGASYACGSGTCKIVQVSVSNLLPEPVTFGWTLTLTKVSWAMNTSVYQVCPWHACLTCKGLRTSRALGNKHHLAASAGRNSCCM